MASEALLSRYLVDFPHYAKRVLKIQDKAARLVPFRLNRAQQRLWEIVKEDLDAERPVRVYVLKARQMGFSTVIEALGYWVTSMRPNRNMLVAAHEDEAAAGLFAKSDVFHKSSPPELRPPIRRANRNELYFANPDPLGELGLESRIVVRTANNRNLGASMTLHFLHLSEFAKYERVMQETKVTMATVLQTVPRLPWTFVFLETTADGMGYAKDFWDEDNGYRKVFVSWVADEGYTDTEPLTESELDETDESKWGNELWLRERIIEELRSWYPAEAADPEWVKRESLCRLRWRRFMVQNQLGGDIELFRQEYPITADEAFLTSGASVFDTRQIRDRIYGLHTRDERGRVTGFAYPPSHFRFDKSAADFGAARYGHLRVYEPPQEGGVYVIGADVAEGVSATGTDSSAAQVLRLPELVQVAVLQTEDLDPDDFAEALYHLGRLYRWAPLCVEANGPGFATNSRLAKELRYPNLYMRETFDQREKVYLKKVGWHTNRATKTQLLSDLRAAVRGDEIIFRDIDTLEEFTYYVQHKDGKLGAVRGKHDDLLISIGLAYQMAKDRGLLRMRQGAKVPTTDPRAVRGTFEWWLGKAEKKNGPKPHSAAYYRQRFGVG